MGSDTPSKSMHGGYRLGIDLGSGPIGWAAAPQMGNDPPDCVTPFDSRRKHLSPPS